MIVSKWDAKSYNEKHSFVFHYGNSLIDLLEPKNDESILDLGCGTGQLTSSLAEKAKYVKGIDLSPEMINSARNNYPDLDFEIENAANFCLKQKFDAIFSNATLHWVTDYEAAIKCMYQAIRTGGRIVLEFGGKGNVQTITNNLRNCLKERGYYRQANIQLWYFPSIADYTTVLERIGFNVSFAQLYDRPTELADERTGIKDWISMFGETFFSGVDAKDKEEILLDVQERVKSELFKNDRWYADYRRLRIVAYK